MFEMINTVLMLAAYLGVAYVPFALCVGLIWLACASTYRRFKGVPFADAVKRSGKEAAWAFLILTLCLLCMGMMAFLMGV